jgi:tetratricopeptide (TPR) repeat protein
MWLSPFVRPANLIRKLQGAWDWPSTEREFKRAIELSGRHGTPEGEPGGTPSSLRARPLQSDSAVLGLALFTAGHTEEEAIAVLTKALALNPEFARTHEYLGRIYTEGRQYDKALEQYRGEDYKGARAYVLARSGDRDGALRNPQEFLARSPSYARSQKCRSGRFTLP